MTAILEIGRQKKLGAKSDQSMQIVDGQRLVYVNYGWGIQSAVVVRTTELRLIVQPRFLGSDGQVELGPEQRLRKSEKGYHWWPTLKEAKSYNTNELKERIALLQDALQQVEQFQPVPTN